MKIEKEFAPITITIDKEVDKVNFLSILQYYIDHEAHNKDFDDQPEWDLAQSLVKGMK